MSQIPSPIASSGDGITVTADGAVAVLTFSRPPHNYFDAALLRRLAEALEALDQSDAIRAILIRSEGDVFCAGAKFSGREGVRGTAFDPAEIYREGLRLFRTRKPIIVAVQGPAVGGGLGLTLVGDFRVVAEESRFTGNFVKIGIHPGFGITYLLPRIVGFQNAAMMLYTGRRLSGQQAREIGLADVVVPRSELATAALALAREIAEAAPLALEATRATLREGLAAAIERQTGHECAEQISLFATDDYSEGVVAVAERRVGNWRRH